MLTLNLSFTITAIIALCALISPIATAVINNRHAEKMKEMEYNHEKELEQERRENDIFEGYIRSAGACIQHSSFEQLSDFGAHSELAMYHVPEDIRVDMITLEKGMRVGTRTQAEQNGLINLLVNISAKLRQFQQAK